MPGTASPKPPQLHPLRRVEGRAAVRGRPVDSPNRVAMSIIWVVSPGLCKSRLLMELELAEHVGAERHERTPERSGYRNGYRERPWDTRVGTIELQVPRVRDGSFFPSLLEPRRRAEKALVAVVQEAYVQGISTRRVRRPGPGAGHAGHQQEPGQPAVRRVGHRGRALPHAQAGGTVSGRKRARRGRAEHDIDADPEQLLLAALNRHPQVGRVLEGRVLGRVVGAAAAGGDRWAEPCTVTWRSRNRWATVLSIGRTMTERSSGTP